MKCKCICIAVNALNKARLEANVRVSSGEKNYKKRWPSPFAIASGLFLLLSFLKYLYHPFQWFALVAVAVGIFPIFLKAAAALRTFTLDINFLMIIAGIYSILFLSFAFFILLLLLF